MSAEFIRTAQAAEKKPKVRSRCFVRKPTLESSLASRLDAKLEAILKRKADETRADQNIAKEGRRIKAVSEREKVTAPGDGRVAVDSATGTGWMLAAGGSCWRGCPVGPHDFGVSRREQQKRETT